MKKEAKEQAGRKFEVAVGLHGLPATASVTLEPGRLATLREKHAKAVRYARSDNEFKAQVGVYLVQPLVLGVTLLGVVCPPLLFGSVPLTVLLWCKIAEAAEQADLEGDGEVLATHKALRSEFHKVQKDAFEATQKELVRLADEHLQRGGLVDEDALAYLAALPVGLLQEASDQLAISVLQARHMLAHARCGQCDTAGNKVQGKPATFAKLGFDRRREDHRALLRMMLAETAPRLHEDEGPGFEELQILWTPSKRRGAIGHLVSAFTAPFVMRKARRAQEQIAFQEIPVVEIPPLRPAKDFSAMLASYDKSSGRLDLPALRGWGKEPKSVARLERQLRFGGGASLGL